MTTVGFALFDTALGQCGIAWGDRGITGVQLPEAGERETRARMLHRFPTAAEMEPPPAVRPAVDAIVALLEGELSDLSNIALDMDDVPPFHRSVYDVARSILPGRTLSYGDIAARLGRRGAARAVGQAMGHNPFPIVVPCHRVLAAGGKIGGFSAAGGTTTKRHMLAIEGAELNGRPTLLGPGGAYGFDPQIAVEHLRACDPALARVVDRIGPFRMELTRAASIFGALAEAIVYQQLTGKAAAAIYGRLGALFPAAPDGPSAEQILGASDEMLRGAGLSRSKMLSLRDLAQRAADGGIPSLAEIRHMPDEAIIEHLTPIRGVGRWTVEMLLIFRLGRPDVLPADDYGIRKGFALACGQGELPKRKELEAYGARWSPYRSVASWYLWRLVEQTPLQRSASAK